MTFACVSVNNFVRCLYGQDGYHEDLRPVKDVDSHEDVKRPFPRILFHLNLQFSSKKYIISRIYVDVCLLWLDRICIEEMCRAQGFAQVVSTSYPVSEKLWIEVCVTWEFTCMFSGYSSHLGLPPAPPAWHRKDHKYGRSFSVAIYVLWPCKATVTNCEYYNQTCTIQHFFYVSVCNQLCSLHLLRWSVKPLTREQ